MAWAQHLAVPRTAPAENVPLQMSVTLRARNPQVRAEVSGARWQRGVAPSALSRAARCVVGA